MAPKEISQDRKLPHLGLFTWQDNFDLSWDEWVLHSSVWIRESGAAIECSGKAPFYKHGLDLSFEGRGKQGRGQRTQERQAVSWRLEVGGKAVIVKVGLQLTYSWRWFHKYEKPLGSEIPGGFFLCPWLGKGILIFCRVFSYYSLQDQPDRCPAATSGQARKWTYGGQYPVQVGLRPP